MKHVKRLSINTHYEVEQTIANVFPGNLGQTLEWRNNGHLHADIGENMRFSHLIYQAKSAIRLAIKLVIHHEQHELLVAKLLVENVKKTKQISSLADVEFRVFSEWGDDGIIQWLINSLPITNKNFIEFGVKDYRESTTRFLMMNNNWSGFVMDGSERNISKIKTSEYYCRYELNATSAFIDCDNINDLISSQSFDKNVGLLHIDLDGNDYWIWDKISAITPAIVIIEYNSVFGIERAITVPYDKNFNRTKAHHSNLYFGASLKALYLLAQQKGYSFIGCNSAGNNAYFVKREELNDVVREVSLQEGYVLSKFRESRDEHGRRTYVTGQNRLGVIRGMPVYNVLTKQVEDL
jgi:hypothetical protein